MNTSDNARELTRRCRRTLDERLENMDAATLEALRRRRRLALSQAQEQRWGLHTLLPRAGWLMPAGAVSAATAAVLAAVLWTQPPEEQPPGPEADLDLLTGVEDLELLENLEFYRWLPEDRRAG